MRSNYYNLINIIENVNRSFLDKLKFEINELNIMDINNAQAIVLYNIGNKTLSVGDLTRNCYSGTNISYNLRNLVENGYLLQQPKKHDRRSTDIKRTEKGNEFCEKLDHIFKKQEKFFQEKGLDEDKIKDIISKLDLLYKNLSNRK